MNESKFHLSTPVGIHRVMKEPYDDREVFTSMDDLWAYCHSGARYNGQKIACIIGTPGPNGNGYIQNFNVNYDFPIISLPNGEVITKTISNKNCVLVYNYNPFALNSSDKIMYSNKKDHCNYLKNPSKFSILNLVKAFRRYSLEKYEVIITRTYIGTNNGNYMNDTIVFDFPVNDFENIINGSETRVSYAYETSPYTKMITIERNTEDCELKISHSIADGGTQEVVYNIIPKKNNENICTKIYISANNYVEAMGGTYG